MYEIKEDLFGSQSDISGLTEQERFNYIQSKNIDPKIVKYLITKFSNLTIEVFGDYKGNVIELMTLGRLEGWCWQTTETCIVFLSDDDYILRGNLKFNEYKDYFHSWIVFKYKGKEYVFDPCLNILCKKEIYDKVFEINVKAKVYAKDVREELINSINNPKKDNEDVYSEAAKQAAERVMIMLFGEDYKKIKEDEVVISGNNDINSPMFRNYTGYKAEIENQLVKKLTAHYYLSC